MQKSVQFIFHLAAAANFGYGIYYDVFKLEFPADFLKATTDYAGRWKYLTFWNMVLQLIYFTYCILNDVLGSSSVVVAERKNLQVLRDYLFGSLVFPVGMFVASIFWILWSIDRELVFPTVLDSFFPVWLNHVMHTSIVPIDMIELIFTPKIFPRRAGALAGLSSLMIGYLVWVFYIAYKTDFWVYPVLAVLNWNLRLFFIVALIFIACLLYVIGEKLHFIFWGKPKTSELTKPQKAAKEVKPISKGPKTRTNKRKQT